MATKNSAARKPAQSGAKKKPKNSLVANINRRKKAGTSRTKEDSTISPEAYSEMQKGWPEGTKKER